MNKPLVLSIFFLSGCALLNDFQEAEFNWWGDPNFKSSSRASAVPEDKKIAKPEDPVTNHLNREVSSTDKKAILRIDGAGISMTTMEGKMSYREGHSVDIIIDSEPTIWKVLPSANKSSPILRLNNPEDLLKKLKDKKNLKISVALDGTGPRTYEFNLPAL